jgi:hypothetical protein
MTVTADLYLDFYGLDYQSTQITLNQTLIPDTAVRFWADGCRHASNRSRIVVKRSVWVGQQGCKRLAWIVCRGYNKRQNALKGNKMAEVYSTSH